MCGIRNRSVRSDLGTITQEVMAKLGTALLSTTLQAAVGRVREKGRLDVRAGGTKAESLSFPLL